MGWGCFKEGDQAFAHSHYSFPQATSFPEAHATPKSPGHGLLKGSPLLCTWVLRGKVPGRTPQLYPHVSPIGAPFGLYISFPTSDKCFLFTSTSISIQWQFKRRYKSPQIISGPKHCSSNDRAHQSGREMCHLLGRGLAGLCLSHPEE